MENTNKDNKLKDLLGSINKQFEKKGVSAPINQASTLDLKTRYVSTGNPLLDEITGGGLPVGHISLLYGTAGSGKSCTALGVAAEQSKLGNYTIYWATEGKPSDETLEMMGVIKEYLYIIEPQDYAENAIDLIERLLYDEVVKKPRGLISALIVDSTDNVVGKKEVDKLIKDGAEGQNMAVRAKILKDLVRRLQGRGMMENLAVVFIAQLAANMNQVGPMSPKDILSGGYALKFGPKLILRLRKIKDLKSPKENRVLAHVVSANVEKNNISGYMGMGEYTVNRPDKDGKGGGLNDSERLVELGLEWGYIVSAKKGSYTIILPEGDLTVIGKKELVPTLKNHPEVYESFGAVIKEGKPKTTPTLSGKDYILNIVEDSEDD